ncbi:MAG: GCG_CRPN prefix-to-repeats domain-containing protein [Caulobacteraceae bacterium]
MLKKVMIAAMAAGVTLAGVSSASAAGGCGPAFHRGPYGGCRPNYGPGAVVVGAPGLGIFYPGRGYWDGHRYWGHRYGWHGGWRYR